MGLPAFKEEFEALVDSAVPQAASLASSSGDVSPVEAVNSSLNTWRDRTRAALKFVATTLSVTDEIDELQAIRTYLAERGVDRILAGIDQAEALTLQLRSEGHRLEAGMFALPPDRKRRAKVLARRIATVAKSKLEIIEEIRDEALSLRWDVDNSTREVVGHANTASEVRDLLKRLRDSR